MQKSLVNLRHPCSKHGRNGDFWIFCYFLFGIAVPKFMCFYVREIMPLLTSNMGKKTVIVLAHFFPLPQRTYSGYILSISPLKYCRSKPCAEAQIGVLRHVLSTWSKWMKTTSPIEQNMLYHTHLGFTVELTSRVPQGVFGEYISKVSPLSRGRKN